MATINRYVLLILSFMGMIAPLAFASSASSVISSGLCNVVNNVKAVVGVIALVLFIVGGALYAVAHMLPASGNLKGNLQGWSLGMLVGGVVGLLIVIIAPWVINLVASSGGLSSVGC